MTIIQLKINGYIKYLPIVTEYLILIVLIFVQKWDIPVFIWNQLLQLIILISILSLKFFFSRLDKSWDGSAFYIRFIGKMWIPMILIFLLFTFIESMWIYRGQYTLSTEIQIGLLISTIFFTIGQLLSQSFIVYWKGSSEIRSRILFREVVNFVGRWTFLYILGAFTYPSFANDVSHIIIIIAIILISMLYEIYFTRLLNNKS